MIRRLALALLGLLALSGEARAHWDIWWDDPPPRLSAAQAARLDLLAQRALAAMQALPADRRARASLGLVSAFNKVGQCRRAEALLPGVQVDPEIRLFWAVQPTLTYPDRACAGRMVAFLAESSRRTGNADELYLAGALWRRIGDETRGQALLAEAERLLDARERGPQPEQRCHGPCMMSAAWLTRLMGLRVYHGTPLYRPELRRLAERRLAGRAERGRDDGDEAFGQLLRSAFEEEAEDVARLLLAREPPYAAQRFRAARMAYLFDEHRFAEALPLGREAGRFGWWNLIGAVQVAPGAFHAERAYVRDWTDRSPELLTELARTFLKRGDPVRAREALQTLRAQVPPDPSQASSNYLTYALAMEALIEAPADPLAALARRTWPHAPFDRITAYGELALHLAYAGRWAEFDRAIAAAEPSSNATELLARLPCIASRSSVANVRAALVRARGQLRGPFRDQGDARDAASRLDTAFWCLIEGGFADAAIEVAGWDGDVRRRLVMLMSAAQGDGTPGAARIRRRLAGLALAGVESGNRWDDEDLLGPLAVAYERLGDHRAVDRILRRAGDPADRFEILLELLDRSRPYPAMLDRIYGFARNA
jgi:hypothetical protein